MRTIIAAVLFAVSLPTFGAEPASVEQCKRDCNERVEALASEVQLIHAEMVLMRGKMDLCDNVLRRLQSKLEMSFHPVAINDSRR